MPHWQKPQNKINAEVCAPPWAVAAGLISLNNLSWPALKGNYDTNQQLRGFSASHFPMSFSMMAAII